MPASLLCFASGWRTLGLAVALPASLAVFSPATFAANVVVVTDSRHPVKTMGGERLIELDEGPRIEAELSAQLPADPEQATAIVKRRLNNGGADLQRRIASAYQGVADAWSLG
ncbi:MAG TPA: TIGR03757 family integrating conjugative element protein, partial [Alicycliphilus sp.]|nr:TIGR03757 family integrating conjugative element protein [Alicycliphilus sp.]